MGIYTIKVCKKYDRKSIISMRREAPMGFIAAYGIHSDLWVVVWPSEAPTIRELILIQLQYYFHTTSVILYKVVAVQYKIGEVVWK